MAWQGTKTHARQTYRQIRPTILKESSNLTLPVPALDDSETLTWGVRSEPWHDRCATQGARRAEIAQNNATDATSRAKQALLRQRQKEQQREKDMADRRAAATKANQRSANAAAARQQLMSQKAAQKATNELQQTMSNQRKAEHRFQTDAQNAANMEEDGWALEDEDDGEVFQRGDLIQSAGDEQDAEEFGSKKQLKELFERAGPVKRIQLPPYCAKPVARIKFETEDALSDALQLDGQIIEGGEGVPDRKLRVRKADGPNVYW